VPGHVFDLIVEGGGAVWRGPTSRRLASTRECTVF